MVFNYRASVTCCAQRAEVKIHDFPFMFHVAVEDVAPGEELLTAYGREYWDTIRDGRRRVRALMPSPSPASKLATRRNLPEDENIEDEGHDHNHNDHVDVAVVAAAAAAAAAANDNAGDVLGGMEPLSGLAKRKRVDAAPYGGRDMVVGRSDTGNPAAARDWAALAAAAVALRPDKIAATRDSRRTAVATSSADDTKVSDLLRQGAAVAAMHPDMITAARDGLRASAAAAAINGDSLSHAQVQLLHMIERAASSIS